MKRKNSTEAIVGKVQLTTELDGLKPIEPKDVIDYEVDDTAEAIKDPMEVLKILLKLNDYKWWVKKFLQGKKYQVLTDEDGKNYFLKDGRIVDDIIHDVILLMYGWKSAYIKRWDYVLFGEVNIRPYKITVCTKFGNLELPALSVDGTTIYFKWNDCLSNDELEAYRLYNQKTEDFNKMELEKKIMADLMAYTQLGTKTLDGCTELIHKIKTGLEALWSVEYCGWKNGIMTLKFPLRMGTDNSGVYHPMVLAPLEISIDFKNRNVSTQGYHPHNIGGSPCLGWALSRLRDECFREKDIYGLVMGMAQFWNSFTSDDCGHTDRDPSKQLIRYLGGYDFEQIISWKDVPFEEIFRTVSFYDANRFVYRFAGFRERCKDWDFIKPLLDVLSKDNQKRFLRALGYTTDEIIDIIKEQRLPERETTYQEWVRAEWGYFDDDYSGDDYDDDYDDEDEDDDDD